MRDVSGARRRIAGLGRLRPGGRERRRGFRVPDVWVEADDGRALAAWVHDLTSDPRAASAEPGSAAEPPEPATVVLIHGWTLDSTTWDRVVDEAARHVGGGAAVPALRVVRYDQRGHGASHVHSDGGSGEAPRPGSSQSSTPASIAQLANDLASVVGALAPHGPLVLVGHSMGGMAVIAAAGRHPELIGERTRGLVLCATSAGGLAAAGRTVAPLMAALAHLPPRVSVPRQPRLLAHRMNYGPRADAALVAATLRSVGPVSGRTTGEWFAALMAHDETAALPALAAAGTPVVVVVGDADRLTPLLHAQAIAEALPQAVLRVVPDTAHMVIVERPDVVVEAVMSLLGA